MITSTKKRSITGLAEKPTDFICVNGILGEKDGWQKQAADWGNANTHYGWSYFYYWTGIFRWGETGHAKELASLIKNNCTPPTIIAHSNGCSVTLEALDEDADVKVKDIHLFAAAAYADCRSGWFRNGLNDAFARGQIERAYIYTSTEDGVLGISWLDPAFFGRNMGIKGPKNQSVGLKKIAFSDLSACAPIVQAVDDTRNHQDWVYEKDGKTLNLPTLKAVVSLYGLTAS